MSKFTTELGCEVSVIIIKEDTESNYIPGIYISLRTQTSDTMAQLRLTPREARLLVNLLNIELRETKPLTTYSNMEVIDLP